MKKVIGYGYKLSKERWDHVIDEYRVFGFHKSRKSVVNAIKQDKSMGNIGKTAKPTIFKMVIEVSE